MLMFQWNNTKLDPFTGPSQGTEASSCCTRCENHHLVGTLAGELTPWGNPFGNHLFRTNMRCQLGLIRVLYLTKAKHNKLIWCWKPPPLNFTNPLVVGDINIVHTFVYNFFLFKWVGLDWNIFIFCALLKPSYMMWNYKWYVHVFKTLNYYI